MITIKQIEVHLGAVEKVIDQYANSKDAFILSLYVSAIRSGIKETQLAKAQSPAIEPCPSCGALSFIDHDPDCDVLKRLIMEIEPLMCVHDDDGVELFGVNPTRVMIKTPSARRTEQ